MKARLVMGKDLEQLQEWYKEWNQPIPSRRSFPYIGFMVDGIAAGFLYQTDSTVCLLDGYITNRKMSHDARYEAMEEITSKLLNEALYRGFHEVIALTKIPKIKERLLNNWNFNDSGQYTLLTRVMG